MPQSREPTARRKWHERLGAPLSGFVAALALAVSTYNVYLQEKQVRAQVWPRLQWRSSWNLSRFAFSIRNGGVGPAEIRSVRILVDDKPVADWREAIARLTGKELVALRDFSHTSITGAVLTPGEILEPLNLEDPAVGAAMFEQYQRLRAEVCYCSVLDDCWELEGGHPKKVSQCKPYGNAFGE